MGPQFGASPAVPRAPAEHAKRWGPNVSDLPAWRRGYIENQEKMKACRSRFKCSFLLLTLPPRV